ncbi:MAG: DUF362 domain-containing protein [Promethearchaeota archaeon]
MEVKTKISIQKIFNDNVEKAVFKALELINAKKVMTKEGMTILIKPNILQAKPPERAVTTHPEVIRAVIHWVNQFNPAKIYVCDSSGGAERGITEKSMKVSGIFATCEEEGVECIPFEKTKTRVYHVKNPLELDHFASSSLIEEVDLIINVPKIKTHGQCLLTCCIKNMFGTILRINKPKTHAQFSTLERFCGALADIYSVSRPQLTVIDGYLCQEGAGPSKGDVVKLNLILAGFDGVALDSVVCKLIGINIDDVKYIKKAEKKGLGTTNLDHVEILGESIENVSRKFKLPFTTPISVPLPRFLSNFVGNTLFKASVKFNPKKCKLCSTCWTSCPVDAIKPPAIRRLGNVPSWNRKKCITCYCCAELCPHEAIDFKVDYLKNVFLSITELF